MDQGPSSSAPQQAGDLPLLLFQSLDARLQALEGEKKSLMKRISENASLSALFLGLVLSCASLYDVFIAKPEAARIAAVSAFNDAINRAAKTRQDSMQLQMQS